MTTLPRDTDPGIYQVCTAANTDYAIPIPAGAKHCIIAFVTSASDNTPIWGRVKFDNADGTVTVTNTNMGHQPPMPVQYELTGRYVGNTAQREKDAYLRVACSVAGAVVKGMWLVD